MMHDGAKDNGIERRISHKLEELDAYYTELLDVLPDTVEQYKQDTEKRRASERLAQLCIEVCIDTCFLLAKVVHGGMPQDEEDVLEIMQKKKVLSPVLVDKLRGMKGFRNILVHRYGEIDDEKAFETLTEHHEDFLLFEKEIKYFLKK